MAATLRVMMNKDGNGGAGGQQESAPRKAGEKAGQKSGPEAKNGYFGPKEIDAYFKKIGPFLGC